MERKGRSRPLVWVLLSAGLLARLLSIRAALRGGRLFFFDTDDYYHLRRMMTAAANFPRLPVLDRYLGYPRGFQVNWPPLYDWCVGGLMRLLTGARPSLPAAQTVAASVPPLAGVATLFLLYWFARRAFGRRAALGALAVGVVLPALVFYTMFGRPDHHCFENFWFAAILLSVLRLCDAAGSRERARAAALVGLCSAAGILFWIGSEALLPALAAFAALEAWLAARRGEASPPWLPWLGGALLFEAFLLLPFCLTTPWGRSGASLFDAPSLFQPLFAAAVGFWALALSAWRRNKGQAGAAFLAAAASGGWLAARSLAGLRAYAAGVVPVFRYAPEMQPLLAPFGRWDFAYVHGYLGWAFWALPLIAFFLARSARRSPPRRLLLIWTLVCAILALTQARYVYELSLPAAVLLGWGAARAARRWGTWPAYGLLALLLLPALKNLAELPLSPPATETVGEDLLESCGWLRQNTPPTRSLWSDEGQPEYGVYAIHDVGDEVAAIAQRPAVAGNMHFLKGQIEDSIAFFLIEDGEQAYQFLRAQGFRYLLVGDLLHSQELQLDQQLYRWNGSALVPNSGGPRPDLWSLVYARLYVLDGSLTSQEGSLIPSVGHFRLVHESPNAAFGVTRDKVFEVVAGARLMGACRSGPVLGSVAVRTDQGRAFVYKTAAPCAAGRFALDAPYPGTWELAAGRARSAVTVSEQAVESGASVAAAPR